MGPDGLLLDEADLEDLRPPLARDEQAVAGSVVRDAVEDVGACALGWREQPPEVDVAGHLAAVGRNTGHVLRHPDVREDLALHVLELVELTDGYTRRVDGDSPLLDERDRIEDAQLARAVRH